MEIKGNIRKMRSEDGAPVQYYFRTHLNEVPLNQYIGQTIKIAFTGKINCTLCGKLMKKSYGNGICYNCNETAPQADPSVFRPELSMAQYGIWRNEEFAKTHDLIEHYVYLALSSGLKVGVTRHHQIPTRWIDQGASFAIRLAKTPNRHIAGVIENSLKQQFADKTNWRNMLRNELDTVELLKEKEKAAHFLNEELRQYIDPDNTIHELNYPVNQYPQKITSLSLDKEAIIEGKLTGIKGQYLYIDVDRVINIRRHEGYDVELTLALFII